MPQVHDPDLHKSVDGTAAFSVLRPAKKNVEQGFKMTCTPQQASWTVQKAPKYHPWHEIGEADDD